MDASLQPLLADEEPETEKWNILSQAVRPVNVGAGAGTQACPIPKSKFLPAEPHRRRDSCKWPEPPRGRPRPEQVSPHGNVPQAPPWPPNLDTEKPFIRLP